jgi:hypothetical protein
MGELHKEMAGFLVETSSDEANATDNDLIKGIFSRYDTLERTGPKFDTLTRI